MTVPLCRILDLPNMVFRLSTVILALFLFSCAPVDVRPDTVASARYAEILSAFSQQDTQLRISRLTDESPVSFPQLGASRDLFIFVHPGYAIFISNIDEKKGVKYRGAKYAMMEEQFLAEARFLADTVRAGDAVILILPGKYEEDSIAPRSYVGYLNSTAGGPLVRHIPSTGTSNGTISGEDMVSLFHFIEGVKPRRVLVGGGYIGRCQREFYSQLTTYYDKGRTFILQEVSTISPEDVTAREADDITAGIKRGNYQSIADFLDRRLDENVNTLSMPLTPLP